MVSLKKIQYCFLWFIFVALCESQSYHIEKIGKEEGLTQCYINCMYMDSRGFLWLGTKDGLFRYDGKEFLEFKNSTSDTTSISDNAISSITEDKSGYIFISTAQPVVNRLDPKTGKFKRYYFRKDYSCSNTIRNKLLFSDKTGTVWFWLPNSLKYYDNKSDRFLNFKTGIQPIDNYVDKFHFLDYYVNSKGTIFFLIGNSEKIDFDARLKVIIIDRKQKKYDLIEINENIKECNFIGENENCDPFIFIENQNHRLNVKEIQAEDLKIINTDYNFDINWKEKGFWISPIILDNNLWLRVDHPYVNIPDSLAKYLGLYSYNNLKSIDYTRKYQIANYVPQVYRKNKIKDFHEFFRNNGILWDCIKNGIIKLIPPNNTINNLRQNETDRKSFANTVIRTVLVDRDNQIWVGSIHGLSLYDTLKKRIKSFFSIKGEKGWEQSNINILFEDKNGRLLAGTNNGIVYLDKKSLRLKEYKLHAPKQLLESHKVVMSLLADNEGNLWVGTMDGLLKFDKNKNLVKQYFPNKSTNSFISNWEIYCIFQDSKKDIWAGANDGLNKYLPEKDGFKTYRYDPDSKNSICGNRIWSIIEDKQKNLWFYAQKAGISKYLPDKDEFLSFTSGDGLNNDKILSMADDNNNNLWFGTSYGLIRFDQNTNSFSGFASNEGYMADDYTSRTVGKTNDGKLVFGGLSGILIFKPDYFNQKTFNPKIVVSKVILKDIVTSILKEDGDSINVDWGLGSLKLQVSVLDYNNPKSNKVAYMFEGMDKGWIYVGNQNLIVFSDLEPGHYILRLKGSNNEGIWNDSGIKICMNIIPPIWKTTWFKSAIYISLGCLLAYSGFRVIKRRREREAAKRKILSLQLKTLQSQMNPHFIFNTLNSILSLILSNKKELSMNYLSKFSKLLRNIIDSSRDFKIPLSREIEQIKMYLELELLRHDNSFTYELNMNEAIDAKSILIPSMLIQPFVENSIIHGQVHKVANGKIFIDFSIQDSILNVKIQDNGIGRKKAKELESIMGKDHKSQGIVLTSDRLSLLNSSIKIFDLYDNNDNPKGTLIDLLIKTEKKDDF